MRSGLNRLRRLTSTCIVLSLLLTATAGAVPRDGRRDRDFVGKVKRFIVSVLSQISSPPGQP